MTLPPYQYRLITAKIKTTSALHVGSGKDERGTDAPLRRNNTGTIILPGTAIAGSLRSLATRLAAHMNFKPKRERCLSLDAAASAAVCGCAVCHLFGEVHPSEKASEQEGGRASRIWIYDAPLRIPEAAFVRDGVGIDRSSGAAARAGRVKFDTEVLSAGAEFELRLELEDPDDDDQILLAAVLEEWRAGRGWLGGNTSRGLGSLVLSDLHFYANPLKTNDQLINFLKTRDPHEELVDWAAAYVEKARQKAISWQPFIQLEFQLAFEGFFLTQDSTASGALGFDHVSLLDGSPGLSTALSPVLPGSGLRGAIRSHAEKIARTIVSASTGDRENFLRRCPACNPLESKQDGLTACSTRLANKKQVKEEELCLACQLFGSSQRGSRLKVQDASLVSEAVWKPVDFLAIDRFTGGGLEGAKFDAAALWKPVFQVKILLDEPRSWELGWLALVVRDIADGLVSFGFGAAKGFGQAKAQDVKISIGTLTKSDWGDIDSYILHNVPGYYKTARFDPSNWTPYTDQVNAWLQDFRNQLDTVKFQVAEGQQDSYFGKVDTLYPLKEQKNG